MDFQCVIDKCAVVVEICFVFVVSFVRDSSCEGQIRQNTEAKVFVFSASAIGGGLVCYNYDFPHDNESG